MNTISEAQNERAMASLRSYLEDEKLLKQRIQMRDHLLKLESKKYPYLLLRAEQQTPEQQTHWNQLMTLADCSDHCTAKYLELLETLNTFAKSKP